MKHRILSISMVVLSVLTAGAAEPLLEPLNGAVVSSAAMPSSVTEKQDNFIGRKADADSLFIIPSERNDNAAVVENESKLGHFTWGGDAGSAVDLTANDMTSINFSAYFGYKGGWFRLAGVGASINTMINNSSRCYPVFGIIRTSFSSRPQLCFLDLRAGVSFNNINDARSQTDFFGSLGLGITLASGRKFSSHIIVSYIFMPVSPLKVYVPDQENSEGAPVESIMPFQDLHYASIRIGCSF